MTVECLISAYFVRVDHQAGVRSTWASKIKVRFYHWPVRVKSPPRLGAVGCCVSAKVLRTAPHNCMLGVQLRTYGVHDARCDHRMKGENEYSVGGSQRSEKRRYLRARDLENSLCIQDCKPSFGRIVQIRASLTIQVIEPRNSARNHWEKTKLRPRNKLEERWKPRAQRDYSFQNAANATDSSIPQLLRDNLIQEVSKALDYIVMIVLWKLS